MSRNMVWVKDNPKPVKLDEWDKNKLKQMVEAEVEKFENFKKMISKIEVKAGRIYFYHLYEPSRPEGAVFTIPLIDGKYIEYILARITVYDKQFQNCSLDFQRHNNQWMTIDSGTWAECIEKIVTSGWYNVLT